MGRKMTVQRMDSVNEVLESNFEKAPGMKRGIQSMD